MHGRERREDRQQQRPQELAVPDSRSAQRELATPASRRARGEPSGGSGTTAQSALAHILARAGAGLLPGGVVHPAVESLIDRRRGAGRVVDERVRKQIEPLAGDSLRDVRIHDDSAADALARSVQARAFATGRDLFFARGEYRPGTASGDRLLAHELTHAAQQRGAAPSGPLHVTEPGDRFEREAERTAREMGG
jgi:hypothetical protein